MAKQINHFYEFGSVRLDATSRLLYKDDKQLSLQPKVIETLLVLVKNARTVVDKDTLISAVWQNVIIEEGGLRRNISLLRKALGEEGRFIETLPKRGYRFTGDVKENWEEGPVYAAEDATAEFVLERRANLRITHEEETTDSSGPRFKPFSRGRFSAGLLTLSVASIVLLVAVFGFWRPNLDIHETRLRCFAHLRGRSFFGHCRLRDAFQ